MTPQMVPQGMLYASTSIEESISITKRQIATGNKIGRALSNFLGRAFGCPLEADELGMAVADFLNFGLAERIESLEKVARQPKPPMPSWAKPYDATERLVELCRRRDMVQSQLDAFEELIGKMEDEGGKNDMMASAMRIQVKVSGVPQQLEALNDEISELQRSIELQALGGTSGEEK